MISSYADDHTVPMQQVNQSLGSHHMEGDRSRHLVSSLVMLLPRLLGAPFAPLREHKEQADPTPLPLCFLHHSAIMRPFVAMHLQRGDET